LIHTLLGLATTIGAERVATVTAEIDQRLKRHAPITASARHKLREALHQARTQLACLSEGAAQREAESRSEASRQSAQADQQQRDQAIEQLHRAITAGELVDEALLAQVTSLIRQSHGEVLALQLQSQVDSFDHDRAAELLQRIATRTTETSPGD
jgi:hypothetical protein